MIACQRPEATRVAGYNAWQKLKRQVRKGEKGIRILAPIVRSKKDKDKDLIELRATVTTALDAWLAKTESKRTRVAYRKDVEQFLEFLGINPSHIEYMTQVLPVDVTDWRDSLLRSGGRLDANGLAHPASNATVARKMTAIRSFFSFLQSYGYRGANPAHPHFVSTPKAPDEGQTPAIPLKQMTQLLTCLLYTSPSPRDQRGSRMPSSA